MTMTTDAIVVDNAEAPAAFHSLLTASRFVNIAESIAITTVQSIVPTK